jgi:hypothetical protein
MADPVGLTTEAVAPGTNLAFGLTFDYRCPFARNLHEHVVEGLRAGGAWQVDFVPFSLNQVHVGEGEPDVWDDPARATDLLAMQVGIAVRDGWAEHFPRAHLALFAARHDRGMDLRDEQVLGAVLKEVGLQPEDVFARVRSGEALATFRREHVQAVAEHQVFGVPTLLVDDRAAFVRIMDRPHGDGERAKTTVSRLVELVLGWPELNELKFTSIPQ